MNRTRGFRFVIWAVRVLGCAFAFLVLLSQLAASDSKIVIRKKFIPKSYNWDSIRRITILPIEHEQEEAPAPRERRKRPPQRPFPADSVIQPIVKEMVRKIKSLDSTIVVMMVGPMANPLPEEMYLKVAAGTTKADALMTIRVSNVEYDEASTTIPGPYLNGSYLPPLGGNSASTRVRVNVALQEAKQFSVIWQIDVEGKESHGGVGGTPDATDPPSPEELIRELVITAASWLPF